MKLSLNDYLSSPRPCVGTGIFIERLSCGAVGDVTKEARNIPSESCRRWDESRDYH